MSATLTEPLLNVREAAQMLRVSVRTVYGLIESGRLPAYRVGGQLRLSRDALAAWLLEQATRTPEKRTPGLAGRKGVREDEHGEFTP
jgi:excisionase family DNA binding protein